MEIAPVFATTNFIKRHDGQGFSSIKKRELPAAQQGFPEDVFVRLSEASYKDARIAAELQAMELI